MYIYCGTYGEKLGHVSGKGSGVYVIDIDASTLTLSEPPADGSFLGKPQLSTLTNPTFITSYRESDALYLYIVDERYNGPGAVYAAKVNEATAELTLLGSPVPASDGEDGAACCYIEVAPGGTHVVVANYMAGSICSIARSAADGTLDPASAQYLQFPPASHPVSYPGANAARQEKAHAHMCLFSKGTEGGMMTVLVPDLGSDCLWCVPFDASCSKSPLGAPTRSAGPGGGLAGATHPALLGGGPRHACLHPRMPMLYVCYELTSLVACFALNPTTGGLAEDVPPLGVWNALEGIDSRSTFLTNEQPPTDAPPAAAPGGGGLYGAFVEPAANPEQTSVLLPSGHGRTLCSDSKTSLGAIRILPDGSHVLVSSRIVGGPGALSAIPLTAEGHFAPSPVRITSTLGTTPRDFIVLSKETALVANQDDDKIVVLSHGQQARLLTEDVPTPVCLCVGAL